MPLEDLDLEFEDEEEQKRKRNESLHDAVDLEFGAAPEKPAASSVAPKPAAVAAADSSVPKAAPTAAGAQVKKIEEVRAKIAQAKNPAAATGATPAARAVTNGSSALQLAPEPGDVNLAQMYQMMEDTKFEARVQVAVAQEKGEFMAEVLSDAKLMQHQVQQLLMRLNQKNPALKPELMAIQKALADFLAKKRK